jgi:YbbR domain-containing protein
MKKKLTNNLTLKIMSVIVGFLVWLIVVNVDNPIVTTTFTISLSNVEVVNEAYIDSMGLMCMPDDSQSQIKVHVTGDRKTIRKLSASNIRAVADLQQAVSLDTDPVMVPITVTCDGISSSNIEVTPTNLTVHLREKLTQEFVVTVTSGESTPGKGYEIGSLTANPEKIKITGPSSLINKIASVTATINVDGITEDETVETELRFIDKNGDVLSESQMNYLNVTRTVSVTAKLWKDVQM